MHLPVQGPSQAPGRCLQKFLAPAKGGSGCFVMEFADGIWKGIKTKMGHWRLSIAPNDVCSMTICYHHCTIMVYVQKNYAWMSNQYIPQSSICLYLWQLLVHVPGRPPSLQGGLVSTHGHRQNEDVKMQTHLSWNGQTKYQRTRGPLG